MQLAKLIADKQDPELTIALNTFVHDNIPEFTKVLNGWTFTTLGGISVAEAFWLYFLVKELQPRQIIESGTFYGWSTYFLAMAAPEGCAIHAFDLDLKPAILNPRVTYHEIDWMGCNTLGRGADTLIFFDDHIDQDRRLNEAIARDQRHIVFHDNYTRVDRSHRPIRFCDLGDAKHCFTFPGIYSDKIFTDTALNAQTYRWLTYISRDQL